MLDVVMYEKEAREANRERPTATGGWMDGWLQIAVAESCMRDNGRSG